MRERVPNSGYHAAQKQHVGPNPSAPRTVEVVVERIQHLLLHYFCEGGGVDATEDQRREYAAGVLSEQLQMPLTLSVPLRDTEHCEELARVEKVVENCLEVLNVRGFMLVPELSDDGRELIIHVDHGSRMTSQLNLPISGSV